MLSKSVKRILNRWSIAYYIITWLFLIVTTDSDLIVNIYGGFSAEKSYGLNIIGLMRWNLCVMPPIVVSAVFMMSEMEIIIFTIIRSKNAENWCILRYLTIVVINILYILIVVCLAESFGKIKRDNWQELCNFIIIFFLHTLLVSIIVATSYVLHNSLKVTILVYFCIEGIMVVVGNLFPQISIYLLPFWGMVKNDGALGNGGNYRFLTSFGFSVISVFVSIKKIKSSDVIRCVHGI